nr:unnamed protein product [Digitaria exilis]
MLRLRAFRPTSDKVVKIQLHPTHPWLVTADANDRVSVWDWEHRQVIYELKAGGVDERRLVGAKLEKLAEGDDSKGKPTEAIRGGSMEFLSRSSSSDAPLVAFGSSDGVIRVLSMLTWKLVRRYTGGHKGAIACLMTYMSAAGEVHLVSGGSDGLLILWSADHIHDSRELVPKISMKAHDGGVVAVELSRVMGSAPQLITIGADKTLAIWDTVTFKVYCMVAHPLQPHLVATGTNIGIILSEFDPRALPAIAPLPTPTGNKEHSAVYIVERELKLLNFQLSNTANPSLGNAGVASDTGRSRNDSIDQLVVKQTKKHISTPAPHDSYSVLSVSSSGKYVAIVWPDIPSFAVYKASDWSVVDSGTGKLFAWDTCRDRYALVESALAPRMPLVVKGGSSKKAKEAAAAAAQAAAAAASAASAATVQVIGLHGGALLGVTYRTSRRISPLTATAISTVQSMPLSGFGGSGSSFASDDPFSSKEGPPQNFQLYSWETYQPVSGLLAQPEWTVWDQTVEYCAFAYQQCVFVDAGVAAIDIETKKRKEEMKAREAQGRAVAEHGDLALITVEAPQVTVVRLASFQHAPSIPPFIVPKQSKMDGDDSVFQKELDDRRYAEVAVAGGGVSVAVTRFPPEQKRPIGPLVVVGVRDGVLWLVDRYMCAHALSLSHPGIRCRCLAAYGDPVSAVKWLEFDLAMQSNDLKRALACLLTMSNSRDVGQETAAADATDVTQILNLAVAKQAKQESLADAVQGIVKFVKEFFDLIDAADATGQSDIAREVLKRLAAAASVKGALHGQMLRGLALRLANHGELTRLSAHGRPSLRNLVIAWNKMLQKELDHTPTVKTDAAAAFLASLEDPKLTSLGETEKKPPIEILPPGMPPLSAPPIVIKNSGTKPGLPNAAQASNGPIGAPMVQGATAPQGTPMVQGAPGAQVPMIQSAPAPSQGTDEAKPSEATAADAAPPVADAAAAPGSGEATAAPGNEEAPAAPGNEEAAAAPVTDASSNTDPAAAAPAPAAGSNSTGAPGVTPVEAAASAPSTETSEATDKPSSTEASPPPPPPPPPPPAYESVV